MPNGARPWFARPATGPCERNSNDEGRLERTRSAGIPQDGSGGAGRGGGFGLRNARRRTGDSTERSGGPVRDRGRPARTRCTAPPAPLRPTHRTGAYRVRGRRRDGHGPRPQSGPHRRLRDHRGLRHPGRARRARRRPHRGGGTPPPHALHRRRDRLRAPLRRRGPRPGLQRHPVALARPHLCRRHGERQARGHRGSGRVHAGGLLGAGRDRRAHQPPLHHDGERQLRACRAALPEPRAARVAGRDPPRRVRLPARPARHPSSPTTARASGAATTPGPATATSTPRTASVPSPTA